MAGLPTCSIFLSPHAVFQTELSGELGRSFLQHPHVICRSSRSLWTFVFAVTVGLRSCHPIDVPPCTRSLCNAANALVEIGGAKEVIACATHGVLSGPALERIEKSALKEVVLLDTIPLPENCNCSKITQLPVAPVFAEAIERIYQDKPVSPLFV